jgi:hypothetical protein
MICRGTKNWTCTAQWISIDTVDPGFVAFCFVTDDTMSIFGAITGLWEMLEIDTQDLELGASYFLADDTSPSLQVGRAFSQEFIALERAKPGRWETNERRL